MIIPHPLQIVSWYWHILSCGFVDGVGGDSLGEKMFGCNAEFSIECEVELVGEGVFMVKTWSVEKSTDEVDSKNLNTTFLLVTISLFVLFCVIIHIVSCLCCVVNSFDYNLSSL